MTDGVPPSFWSWFARGSGGKPGYRRLINCWLIIHIGLGGFLAFVVQVDLQTAANTVLLPLVGILIGLCFAWGGNAQALLQTDELEEMTKFHEGGYAEYVYTYQAAIFAILVTLVAWALAGFGSFDKAWPTESKQAWYFLVKNFLFTLSSLTIRECWHVVLGAQWMLLTRHEIRQSKRNKNKN